MMQMFKYPQGEGGHEGRNECRNECKSTAARRYVLADGPRFTPLLSRFVTRSLRPQTLVGMGGHVHGC
ncbi:hypothetical protein EDF73_102347 [Raoultella sp. BIGb0138]|nr:hypothetical protein EDF73_102347 [Raoultella sp. BIGb0138]